MRALFLSLFLLPATLASAQTATVIVSAVGVSPSRLVVPPGTTVTWQNEDDRPHRLTGPGFDTGVMQPFDTFSLAFPVAGEVTYADASDSRIRGRVVVRIGAIPPPDPGSSPGGGARGAALAAGGAGGFGRQPLSMNVVTALVTGIPLFIVLVGALLLRPSRSRPRAFGSKE